MRKYQFLEPILFLPTYLNKNKLANKLVGKSVLITGASSGIGKQLAYRLANIDCHLILTARRGDVLLRMKKEIEMQGAKVSVFQADLRNEDELDNLIITLQQLSNGLDIVVNNAGHSIKRSIFDSLDRYHDFTRTMAINYFAPVRLLLATIPLLKQNRGQIINISTVNALLVPIPYFSGYQASKIAFDVWLRSVTPELKSAGITTTGIYLPLVKTPMIEPNVAYLHVPAMSADHVAKIICKSMYTQKKRYRPWWLVFGQLASVFLNSFNSIARKKGR